MPWGSSVLRRSSGRALEASLGERATHSRQAAYDVASNESCSSLVSGAKPSCERETKAGQPPGKGS